jgi:hypothetical protein
MAIPVACPPAATARAASRRHRKGARRVANAGSKKPAPPRSTNVGSRFDRQRPAQCHLGGRTDSAAGGLPASGHGRISRRLGWRRLRAGTDGDPAGLSTSRRGGYCQRPVPYQSPDMVESCWESRVDLSPASKQESVLLTGRRSRRYHIGEKIRRAGWLANRVRRAGRLWNRVGQRGPLPTGSVPRYKSRNVRWCSTASRGTGFQKPHPPSSRV